MPDRRGRRQGRTYDTKDHHSSPTRRYHSPERNRSNDDSYHSKRKLLDHDEASGSKNSPRKRSPTQRAPPNYDSYDKRDISYNVTLAYNEQSKNSPRQRSPTNRSPGGRPPPTKPRTKLHARDAQQDDYRRRAESKYTDRSPMNRTLGVKISKAHWVSVTFGMLFSVAVLVACIYGNYHKERTLHGLYYNFSMAIWTIASSLVVIVLMFFQAHKPDKCITTTLWVYTIFQVIVWIIGVVLAAVYTSKVFRVTPTDASLRFIQQRMLEIGKEQSRGRSMVKSEKDSRFNNLPMVAMFAAQGTSSYGYQFQCGLASCTEWCQRDYAHPDRPKNTCTPNDGFRTEVSNLSRRSSRWCLNLHDLENLVGSIQFGSQRNVKALSWPSLSQFFGDYTEWQYWYHQVKDKCASMSNDNRCQYAPAYFVQVVMRWIKARMQSPASSPSGTGFTWEGTLESVIKYIANHNYGCDLIGAAAVPVDRDSSNFEPPPIIVIPFLEQQLFDASAIGGMTAGDPFLVGGGKCSLENNDSAGSKCNLAQNMRDSMCVNQDPMLVETKYVFHLYEKCTSCSASTCPQPLAIDSSSSSNFRCEQRSITIVFFNQCVRNAFNRQLLQFARRDRLRPSHYHLESSSFTDRNYLFAACVGRHNNRGTVSRVATHYFPMSFMSVSSSGQMDYNPRLQHVTVCAACLDTQIEMQVYKNGVLDGDVSRAPLLIGAVFSGVSLLTYVIQFVILLAKGVMVQIKPRRMGLIR